MQAQDILLQYGHGEVQARLDRLLKETLLSSVDRWFCYEPKQSVK